MPKFDFLPNIATADIAFEAFGKSYSELFENAALALEETMVSTTRVKPLKKYTIKKEADNVEDLLYLFLEELVYLKDAEQMVFSKIDCKVKKVESSRASPEAMPAARKWKVESELKGEKIDPEWHKLGDDVKAVTKHLFKVEQLPDKTYKCLVILDV